MADEQDGDFARRILIERDGDREIEKEREWFLSFRVEFGLVPKDEQENVSGACTCKKVAAAMA